MAVARLPDVQRADMERPGGLTLQLEVREGCAFTNRRLRDDVREVRTVAEAGEALDNRGLSEAVEHDEVARVGRALRRRVVADEQQVNGTSDFDVPRDVDHRAVVDERGVERRESMCVERR